MPFTDEGAKQVALRLGSAVPSFISAIGIGSGSGTAKVTDKILINEHTRTVITGSPDFATAKKVQFQADFAATTMPGLILTEFGLFISGPTDVGSVWQRESFGSILFTGTEELQILATLEVIPR